MFLQSLQEINIYRFTMDLRLHFADSANKIFNLSCSKDGISEQNSKYITEYRFKSQYKIKKFFTFEASNIYFPILLELTINHEILPVFLISGIPNSETKFVLCFYTYLQPCTVYIPSVEYLYVYEIFKSQFCSQLVVDLLKHLDGYNLRACQVNTNVTIRYFGMF